MFNEVLLELIEKGCHDLLNSEPMQLTIEVVVDKELPCSIIVTYYCILKLPFYFYLLLIFICIEAKEPHRVVKSLVQVPF